MSLLFDTGATVSLISRSAFNRASKAGNVVSKYDGKFPTIRNASGTAMTMDGIYGIKGSIMGITMVAPFIVSPQVAGDGIMGMNVIRGFQLGMDSREGVYITNDGGTRQMVNCTEERACWAVADEANVAAAAELEQRPSVEGGPGLGPRGMHLRFTQAVAIQARTAKLVRCQATRDDGTPVSHADVLCEVAGMDLLVHTDQFGAAKVYVPNASCELMQFTRGEVFSTACLFDEADVDMPCEAEVAQASEGEEASRGKDKVKPLDPKLVDQAIHKTVSGQLRSDVRRLIHEFEDVVSRDKHDLGLSDTVIHDVELGNKEPVYTQQYRLPLEQLELVKEHLGAWLRSGIVEPARSKYNSPVFCVPKKEGHGLRVVLDYRKLNAHSLPDKYSIKSVEQCLEEVGTAGSSWFSCLDLRSGFWQLKLAESARPLTAFTIPGVGQFQYCVAPMGLAGSPASFSRLMDLVMKDMSNVITYIDDCLVHSASADTHVGHLRKALARFRKNGLKINLEKCTFATREIQYLGHTISGRGIRPGRDKAEALTRTQPPANAKQVRMFVGLCNYFRPFIPDFAARAAPLFRLTRNDSQWEGGKLPADARQAFFELRQLISAAPILAFPTRNGHFKLYTDAALGDSKAEGGLGAALMQMQDGKERVIAYASRRLIKHEKNYPAFLLELQAATWACEQFAIHLTGRRFTILTDHKPLTRLDTVHTRTLNRLQHKMREMFPTIEHVQGKDNPVADFLSRYEGIAAVQEQGLPEDQELCSLDMSPFRIAHLQAKDATVKRLGDVLRDSADPAAARKITGCNMPVALVDDVVLVKVRCRAGMLAAGPQLRILAPRSLQAEVVQEAHEGAVAGHGGIHRTAERIRGTFWWSNMEQDIAAHIARCAPCQATSTKGKQPLAPLQPLQVPDGPNERVHIDLFGPIKEPNKEKSFVLVMTDAFSKWVELAPVLNKEPATVAEAFLNSWVYRHGSPKLIISDQGTEFVAQFSKAIWSALNIEHKVTTPYHPQTNAQAEVFNKTLAGYLRACIYERKDRTTSWRNYLPALAFSHNTAVHSSTKTSPFRVTYGYDPRVPMWQDPSFMRQLGTSPADLSNADAYARMREAQLEARRAVYNNLQHAQGTQKRDFDKRHGVAIPTFKAGDLVWAQIMHTTDPNRKLAPKYEKAEILERMTTVTYRIRRLREGRGRKCSTVNAYLLKPRAVHEEEPPQEVQPTNGAQAVNMEQEWTPAQAHAAMQSGEITDQTVITQSLITALLQAGYSVDGGGDHGRAPTTTLAPAAYQPAAPPSAIPQYIPAQQPTPAAHITHTRQAEFTQQPAPPPKRLRNSLPTPAYVQAHRQPSPSPVQDQAEDYGDSFIHEDNTEAQRILERSLHLENYGRLRSDLYTSRLPENPSSDDHRRELYRKQAIEQHLHKEMLYLGVPLPLPPAGFPATKPPQQAKPKGGKGTALSLRRALAGLQPLRRHRQADEPTPDTSFTMRPASFQPNQPVNRPLFRLQDFNRPGTFDRETSELGTHQMELSPDHEQRWTRGGWLRKLTGLGNGRHDAAHTIDADAPDPDLSRSIIFLNSGRHATISR